MGLSRHKPVKPVIVRGSEMSRLKTCRTHHGGAREYICTCTSDSWSEPGETCGECEMASEDFEDDMPFDFHDWEDHHREAEDHANG